MKNRMNLWLGMNFMKSVILWKFGFENIFRMGWLFYLYSYLCFTFCCICYACVVSNIWPLLIIDSGRVCFYFCCCCICLVMNMIVSVTVLVQTFGLFSSLTVGKVAAAAWWPLLWIQDVSSDKAATDHWCIGGAWVSCSLIGRYKPSCFLIGWWTGHGPLMYRRTIITESLNAAALCKTRSFHFQWIPVRWRQNVLQGGVRLVKILLKHVEWCNLVLFEIMLWCNISHLSVRSDKCFLNILTKAQQTLVLGLSTTSTFTSKWLSISSISLPTSTKYQHQHLHRCQQSNSISEST